MNAALRKVATLDPEYVKRERRREIRFWGSLFLAFVAIAGATWAVVVNGRQDTQLTRIEQSACAEDPAGRKCAELRAEIAEAEPLRNPCISHQRVEGTKGRNCPRFYISSPNPSEVQASPKFGSPSGSGKEGQVGAGGLQGGGAGDAGPPAGHQGGTPGGSENGSKSPAASPGAGSGGAPADTQPDTSPLPSTVEALEGTVREAGKVVGEVVGGAGATGCGLLLGGC